MVEALGRSGESAAVFARRHGLELVRVERWARRLARAAEPANAEARSVPFAPVRVVAEQSAAPAALEVVVGGAVVRVGRDFDAELLRRVVAALAEAAC